MAYTIKAKHGDDLRRLTLSSPHISQLTSTVTSLFNLPSSSSPSSSSLKIRYMDDDGDWITISSDQELQEAFLTVKGLPLRVDVISTATPTFPVAIAVGEPVPAPVSPSSSTSSFAVIEGNAQVLSDEEEEEEQEQQDDNAEESEEEEEQESSESEEEEEEEEEDDDESEEESEDEEESEEESEEEESEEEEEEEQEEEEQECVTGSSSSVTLAEEKQPQEDDTSSTTTTIVVNVDDEMEGKAAAAADDDFIPPPPPVEDADQKLQPQAEAEEKKKGEEEEEPPRAELFDYVANEFHYHRIIIQTAVEAAFDSIRSQYTATYKPKATEYLNKADTQRVLIIEAIERTLEEWKRDINTYPPAQEISQRVSDSLHEIGTFAAPVLDNIRASLTAALESLFKKKNPHAITSSDVLRELDTFTPRAEDIPEQPQEEHQPQEQQESPMSEETSRITEEIESVLSQVSVAEPPQAPSDIHVGSELAGDFVYVQEDDDFAYKQQLEEILMMGFTNPEAIRTALINFEGNVEATLDSLL